MAADHLTGGGARVDCFPHVYGQPRLKSELGRLFAEGRVPHTMIFYGDEGLGKTTAALDLAGALAGQDVSGEAAAWAADPQLAKEPVLTAAEERVWYLRPVGTELRIDQFRLFLDAMAAFDGAAHVCIIDEAQTMMPAAANVMLKTLEEPPAQVYFILITHDLDALLPTIVSRGERFPFFPLSRTDYEALLAAKPAEYPLRTPQEIEEAFFLSGGNPGLTKEMFGTEGAPQPETAMQFWEQITDSPVPFSEGTAEAVQDRKEFRRMLRWMLLIGRDLLVEAEAPGADLVRCRQMAQREARIAPAWDGGRAEAAIEALSMADAACRRYISVKNIWDMILISLVRIRKGQ